MFEYCGWGAEQIALFLDIAKTDTSSLSTVYDTDKHTSFEHWLAYCIGEFCVMHMPRLMGPAAQLAVRQHEASFAAVNKLWMHNVIASSQDANAL